MAVIAYDSTYEAHLWVISDGVPVMIQTGRLEAGFPVTSDPDGNVIYVESPVLDATQPITDYRVSVNRIAPQAGAQPEPLGEFSFMVGCGGGSPLPADWLYWQESGFGGSPVIFQWTNYGIMHSLVCSGSGLGLFDPATGQDRIVIPDGSNAVPQVFVTRFVLSPDQMRVAGINQAYDNNTMTTSLVVVDLQSGTMTELAPAQEPHQVVWLDNNTLAYSSRTAVGDILGALTAEQQQTFDTATGGFGTELSVWQVSITLFDPASGTEQPVFSGDAYEVGRMELNDDGILWFSLVPNMGAWVNAIANGTLDPVNDDSTSVLPVSVYHLHAGEVSLVGDNLRQFILQPMGM